MSDSSNAVFLSYASQDAVAAAAITRALRAAGIEVWFDQSELRGGDAWDTSIRRQIKACSLFIPVISKNTHAREEGYFRLEWKLAVDRSHLMASTKAFLLPVVIDGTRDDDDRVPDRFRDVQWTRLPEGRATPAFIERVSKLLISERAPETPIASPGAETDGAGTVSPRSGHTRPLVWLGVAALIITGAAEVYRLTEGKHEGAIQTAAIDSKAIDAPTAVPPTPPSVAPAASAIPEKSIAVLPFVDMSEKKDQEYFSDGLAEELLDMLAQIRDLHVAARTSSFSFRGKSDDVAVIAQKLRVAHVLEGSVRRSGDVIRVTAQLIRADNGYGVWSKTYDRQVKDIFKVQDEIAAAVVDALKLQLMPSQQIENRHWTPNTEAYTQYLLGIQDRVFDTAESNARALAAFQKAVTLDPNYAAAYAELGETEWRVADQTSNDSAAYARALAAVNKAIALAPDSPEGYWARGGLRNYHDWDWNAAQLDYEKALALDSNFVPAYVSYANLLATLGRMKEAEETDRKALALDPLSIDTWRRLGFKQIASGQFEQALAAAQRIRELNPLVEDRLEGYAKLHSGRLREALAVFEDQPPTAALKLQGIAMAEYSLGNREASDRALDEFIKSHSLAFSYQCAQAYAWRGDTDKAFEWLETAYRIHDGGLPYVTYDRNLEKIRSDPRYNALLRKMNLAPVAK